MSDGVYDKYRVVKTEDLEGLRLRITDIETWAADIRNAVATVDWIEDHAIDTFVFVLRPDRDYHARVALFAYAASVDGHNPQLASDLFEALQLMETPTSLVPD